MGVMSTQFRKVEPASIERRKAARTDCALRMVTIRRPSARSYPAQLADLSKYGCRLVLKSNLNVGQSITIQFGIGKVVNATIVWNADSMLGCRFSEMLDPTLFRQMMLAAN
jgi:c-di-GMP-binding flagellar brake protein YcgR